MSILKGWPGWRSPVMEKAPSAYMLSLGLKSHAGLILGGGTSADPVTTAVANKNFVSLWLKSSATSGTSRGMYLRLYLSAGAGGEALRAFTTVESNTPGDTANGAHISLNFGSSAGNITGLGTAARFTLHVPNRALTGTVAAVQAELWADGASSANGGRISFVRFSLGGNATGITALTQHADCVAFHFDAGCVDATNGIIDSNRTSNTNAGCIKIYIDGVGTRWISYGTGQ